MMTGATVPVDTIVSADRIYVDPDGPGEWCRALAISGGEVIAAAAGAHDLDHLSGPRTQQIDLGGRVVLPGFDDTHTHLMAAVEAEGAVPLAGTRSIEDVLRRLRARALDTPAGQWIRTGSHWQELDLAERRLPTLAELDSVSTRHPILVQRGGHNAVANSLALSQAGIGPDVKTTAGGHFGRDTAGVLDGRLRDAAVFAVTREIPAPSAADRRAALVAASRRYAATGITTVRDCHVPAADLNFLGAARAADTLPLRVRALVGTAGMSSPEQVAELVHEIEPWRSRGDERLRVWGLKFVLDGGIEAGATTEPYRDREDYFGVLGWDPAELDQAIEIAVAAGWRVGVHAYGDRAVDEILAVFAQTRGRHPGLPVGALVIEHAGLTSAAQRHRASQLGVAVTVQQPLLQAAAKVQENHWGQGRVDRLFPVRSWLDAQVEIAAGSDYPVGMYGAMRSVWGMVTRETNVGVRGAEEAVDVATAIALHTTRAAQLLGEDQRRGRLQPGYLADLTVWSTDPYQTHVDRLRDLMPDQTWVAGTALPN